MKSQTFYYTTSFPMIGSDRSPLCHQLNTTKIETDFFSDPVKVHTSEYQELHETNIQHHDLSQVQQLVIR